MSLPAAAPPRFSDIDWRWALPRILLVFVVTRLLLLGVAVAAEATHADLPPPAHLVSDDRPLLTTLTAWDGSWYRGIAEDGYHADIERWPDYAFYPLYPATIRVASVVTAGDSGIAALLVSNVAFALALVAFYALSVRYLSPDRALFSLWLLGLAPGALAFSLAYTESLFLLLAIASFLAAEVKRFWLAGLLVALATLARPTGILLVLPLAVLYLQRAGWRPSRALLPLVLAPMVWLCWFGYVWWLTGDPMATFEAQSYWDTFYVPSPDELIANDPRQLPQIPVILAYYFIVGLYTFSIVYLRPDRFPHAYRVVVVMAIASLFLAGRLDSAVRYLVVAWPVCWAFATRESRLGRAVVMGMFTLLQVGLTWYIVTWNTLP